MCSKASLVTLSLLGLAGGPQLQRRFYIDPLMDDRASYSVSKGHSRPPVKETHFTCIRDFCSYPCAYTNKLRASITKGVMIKGQKTNQKVFHIITYTPMQEMLALWQNYNEGKKKKQN